MFLDPDGRAWLIDFGFAELAATDAMLDEDAAELLSSTYTKVGAERAVAAAVEALGPDPVAAALRYVQPAALSTATRKAVNALPGKGKPLQAEILRATGIPEPDYVQVERVSARRVAIWLFTGVAVYFLIHQLSDVSLLTERIRGADWRWLPAIVAMSVLSYVAATMSAIGSVPDQLPPWPTFVRPERRVVRQLGHTGQGRRPRPERPLHGAPGRPSRGGGHRGRDQRGRRRGHARRPARHLRGGGGGQGP